MDNFTNGGAHIVDDYNPIFDDPYYEAPVDEFDEEQWENLEAEGLWRE